MYERIYTIVEKSQFLSKYLNRRTIPQISRYLLVGFTSTTLEVVLFKLLLEKISLTDSFALMLSSITILASFSIIQLKLYIANTIAYTLVFIYNYMLQRNWTFKSNSSIKRQIILYSMLFGFNLFISNKLVEFLYLHLHLGAVLSKLIAIAVVVSWNFILYKKVIFKN